MSGLGFALAGLVVGTAVGATGVGGGSLMTPILILFYGISPAVAVGTDLLYASISKAFGVLLHGRNGTLDWKIVGWLSLGSLPAALLTLLFLRQHGADESLDRMIKLVLAAAIIVTATFSLFQDWISRRMQGGAFGLSAVGAWRRTASADSGLRRADRRAGDDFVGGRRRDRHDAVVADLSSPFADPVGWQ